MKKRLLSVFLSLALCLGLFAGFSVQAAEASGTYGENITWSLSGSTLTIEGTGEMSDYSWAEPPGWNDYREGISTVLIKAGVTSIGSAVFNGCTGLTGITLPDGLTKIGDAAFYGCTALKSITLPEGLTAIGDMTFASCSGLTSVTLPEGLTAIGSSAFEDCSGLTGITLPDSLITIKNAAFSGCTGLTNLTLPEWLSTIDGYAFKDCSGLKSVTLPDSLNTIAAGAFKGCSGLVSLTLPEWLSSIGDSAFSGCSGLKSVTLPDGLITIADGAFSGCSGLVSITLPEWLSAIGDSAFLNCSSLIAVCFRGNTPSLGANAFVLEEREFTPNPKLVLYYIEGRTDWTTPTWNGYPTKTWDGVNVPEEKLPFTDVAEDKWYSDAVSFVYSRGLFAGTTPTTFAPEAAMTRAMLVSVLWREEGQPIPKGSNPFTDVPAGKWFTKAVVWAAENKIVSGTGEGKFNPNGNVTREQIAVMMLQYAKFKGRDTSNTADLSRFPDSGQVAGWAKAALSWANAEGLVTGAVINGQTVLNPQGNASRSQVASILMRYVQMG